MLIRNIFNGVMKLQEARVIVLSNRATDADVFGANYEHDTNLKDNEYVIEKDDIKLQFDNVTDVEEMKSFVRNAEILVGITDLKEEIKNVISKDEEPTIKKNIKDLIKSGEQSFVVLNTDDLELVKKVLEVRTVENVKVVINTDKTLAEEMGFDFPGIYNYDSKDKFGINMTIPNNILSIIPRNRISFIDTVTHSNRHLFQGIDLSLYFLIDKSSMSNEEIKQAYFDQLKPFANDSRFFVFKTEEIVRLVDIINPKQEDFPLLVHLEEAAKYVVRNISPANVVDAVKKFKERTAERIIVSESIPNDNDSLPLKVASYYSIEPEVINKTGVDRIVLFTSLTCGYCKQLKPIYNKLGELVPEVKVFNYVLDNNDIPESRLFDLSGVPKAHLFKKGSNVPIDISNARDMKSILTALEDNKVADIKVANFQEQLKEADESENMFAKLFKQINEMKENEGDEEPQIENEAEPERIDKAEAL